MASTITMYDRNKRMRRPVFASAITTLVSRLKR